jgi:hypothetical protein
MRTFLATASPPTCSNRATTSAPCKSPHVDAPVLNSALIDDEIIMVVDPTHPLYGRRFPILRLCHAARGDGFVEVRYRESLRLRVPLAATDRATFPLALPRTKLTLDAIRQLIALVKECHAPCPCPPAVSGPDSPTT